MTPLNPDDASLALGFPAERRPVRWPVVVPVRWVTEAAAVAMYDVELGDDDVEELA